MALISKLLLATLGLLSVANAWKTVSTHEWESLDQDIEGSVVLPTDESYASEYVLWASTFDNVYPSAIVKCMTNTDVQKAYQLILDHYEVDLDGEASIFSLRCGKHNMIGASTTSGVVIDVSQLNQLEIKDETEGEETALVGPGVNLSQFTSWAEEHDVTLPHGDCASVTFGGFLQGGGLGLTSRTFGMGADWVRAIDIVLADGSLVTASDDNEFKDLFWAVLGGGGQNFGIITQYEMNIPEKKQVNPGLYVELTWDYDFDTWKTVSAAWQEFMNNDEYQDHFAMYLRLQPAGYLTQDYYVGLHGFWTGEQTTGLLVLAELLTEVNLTPATAKIDYVHFEGWIESSSSDRVRYSSQCKSRFAYDDLDDEFFQKMGEDLEDLIAYESADELMDGDDESFVYPTQFMFISPADGAIQTHNDDRVSFVHRDAKYFFAMCGRWRDGYAGAEDKMKNWMSATIKDLEPHLSPYSFVSFPDWDLKDWATAYYKDNYPRLQEVKAKYDPNYMFRYSQSIVPKGWAQSTNDALQLPLHSTKEGEISQYRQWENKQRQLAATNGHATSSLPFDLKSVELWCFIIGGIILGFAVFHFLFKKQNSKDLKQYTPLKSDTHGRHYEVADDTENVVVL